MLTFVFRKKCSINGYFIYCTFTGDPCNLTGLRQSNLFKTCQFFCFKSHIFLHAANEGITKQAMELMFTICHMTRVVLICTQDKIFLIFFNDWINRVFALSKILYFYSIKSCNFKIDSFINSTVRYK